jgi:DHA2 family multidrug resistance protein
VAHGAASSDAAVQALGQLYGLVQRQAAMLAVADTFWVLALVFLSMIPLVVCLRMTPLHKGPMVMD